LLERPRKKNGLIPMVGGTGGSDSFEEYDLKTPMKVKNFTENDKRALLLFLERPHQPLVGPADIGRLLFPEMAKASDGRRTYQGAARLGLSAMKRLEQHGLIEDARWMVPATYRARRSWVLTSKGMEKITELRGQPEREVLDLEAVEQPALDCQNCGACCSYFSVISMAAMCGGRGFGIDLQDYDDVSGLPPEMLGVERVPDGARFPPQVVLKTKKVGKWHQCVGLEGRVGSACRCSVYEARPLTCSEFVVGGSKCLKAREARGLSVDEMNPID
jgi:uncharacterized protein